MIRATNARLGMLGILHVIALAGLALLPLALLPAPSTAAPATQRWGYYVTYDNTSLATLQQHIGQLDVVVPYFYQLNADGTLKDTTNPTALALLRAAGVRILPMIKNVAQYNDFHTSMASPAQRDAVATTITNLVLTNNYDGIHIDFEGLNPADGSLLTDFMQRLAVKLHAQGKMVTQALAARTNDAATGWAGAFDYAALGKVNDFVAIMAYDFHYAGGSPGAVAPANWVQQVAAYTTTRIPAEKVILGVPFYGYDWDTTSNDNAHSVRFDQTATLLAQPGVARQFDSTAQTPWFTYKDSAGHAHEVWYEDADSLNAKLQVMLDNRLAGFASWRLGQEDPAAWTEIARLNTPATRIPPFTSSADRSYFSATGHSLAYGFKNFWNQSGGLPVFGYPQTEEFSEGGYTVQYFERQRFEYHPEFKGSPYEVELGLLGWSEVRRLGLTGSPAFRPLPANAAPAPGCENFPETGHSLCGLFRDYWHGHGLEFGDSGVSYRESLALFGYPISQPFTDPASGLTVQYFERARFEYHPENAAPYDVLLGLLGNDELQAKGWIR